MGINLRRLSTVFFVTALLLLSTSTVSLVYGQSSLIPKPAVPVFTATLGDHSYDVPETTSIDRYTGQTISTPAHRLENYTIDLTIKNQPYTPTIVQAGTSNWTTSFNYNIQVKGHFAKDWIPMYTIGEGPKMANSQYTTIAYQLSYSQNQNYSLVNADPNLPSNSLYYLPPNSKLDFQVEALIGGVFRGFNASATDQLSMYPYEFTGQESGWSSTQTVTLPGETNPNPSASPTQSNPTINTGPVVNTYWGLSYGVIIIIGILAVIAVLLTVLIAVIRGRKGK